MLQITGFGFRIYILLVKMTRSSSDPDQQHCKNQQRYIEGRKQAVYHIPTQAGPVWWAVDRPC